MNDLQSRSSIFFIDVMKGMLRIQSSSVRQTS